MKPLEYVCFGTYGDTERLQLVLDVPQLATRVAGAGPDDHRLIATIAIDQLREAGAVGVIIARMNGVPHHRRWVS